jgi:hypothetical protein
MVMAVITAPTRPLPACLPACRVLAAEQADTLAIAARFANKPAPANKRSKVAERVASSGMMMSPAGSTNLDVALSKEYEPTSYCIKGLQVGDSGCASSSLMAHIMSHTKEPHVAY